MEGIVHQTNFYKHFSCYKFKLLSTAGYSFFSKITRITLILIDLITARHEVHIMNTHTLQNAGR